MIRRPCTGATRVPPSRRPSALAWLLAQGGDILPTPGTKRVRYLEENAAAADVRLTPEQRDRLGAAVPVGAVAGERYPEASMRTVGH